jgi:hypothetical protein
MNEGRTEPFGSVTCNPHQRIYESHGPARETRQPLDPFTQTVMAGAVIW